eukprot:1129498-Pelagomonas_calceolata.AAC.1
MPSRSAACLAVRLSWVRLSSCCSFKLTTSSDTCVRGKVVVREATIESLLDNALDYLGALEQLLQLQAHHLLRQLRARQGGDACCDEREPAWQCA